VKPVLLNLAAQPAAPAAPVKALTPAPDFKTAASVAVWHTDMMALYYSIAAYLGMHKLAMDAGGYIVDKEKVTTIVGLEKNTMPGWMLNIAQAQPFPWLKKESKKKKESDMEKDSDDSFLQLQERRVTNEKDSALQLNLWIVWYDVLANYHIVMACLYSMPAAMASLKTPTYKGYVTFWKVTAFWYWASTQWWVDLLDMYAMNGGKVEHLKYWDSWALRLKDNAFTAWWFESIAIMNTLGAPTKSNLVNYLSVADSLKLVELAKTGIWIAYMAEAGIKGAAGLATMMPSILMSFAHTAFHQDLIARISA
jgi:hypothetical protein